MNRTEQKQLLKNISNTINVTVLNLKSEETKIEKIIGLAEELNDEIQNLGYSDSFDLDEFKDKLINDALEQALTEVYDEIYDFKNDLDYHISELSETKAENLEERYSQLEDVLEKFNQSSQEYSSIGEALEHIDDAIDMLKEML